MKTVDLRKILSRKYGPSAIGEMMRAIDKSIVVLDANGIKILGAAAGIAGSAAGVEVPIRQGENVIGWVSGGDKVPLFASFLGHIAEKEMDTKLLARDTLDKYKELNMLYGINEKIATCLDPAKVAQIIIAEVRKLIRADNASVMLMNDETGFLEIAASSGSETNPKTVLRAGEGIAGHVYSSGRAEIVNEVVSDRRFIKGSNRVRSMMCAPLTIKEKVIGVINVSIETLFDYSAADLKFLCALASPAASAIEIARLYDAEKRLADELKLKNRELRAAREMLAKENVTLKQDLRQKFSPGSILGVSRQMKDLFSKMERIADTPVSILITGETGTGKELIAKTMHYNSGCAGKLFAAINCSAIPESIFESEMFGIEKGVATGVEKRMGKIEQADGGTLFLDEIGDMPLLSQAKILRVIEERKLERVGGREPIAVNIRIIAATNKDLKYEINKGTFREDLFYRLNVVNLHIPPLRDRRDDIPLLCNHFLVQCIGKLGKSKMHFSADAAETLKKYDWPGNVRELENEVERAVALCSSDVIGVHDLSDELKGAGMNSPHIPLATVSDTEKTLIVQTLTESGGNKSKAARSLGISREGLRKKMKRLGL